MNKQPVAILADVQHWEKSLSAVWPADDEEAQGAWIIGSIDEDGNKFEVITVEADQYDAPGDSEKIARAVIALWAQGFTGPIEHAVTVGTTSDKYRAELYDEVWQKARGLGYGNVTNALIELERLKAAQIAQDRDAARYRFLRKDDTDPRFLASDMKAARWLSEYMLCGDRMDAAIDRAMKQPSEKPAHG